MWVVRWNEDETQSITWQSLWIDDNDMVLDYDPFSGRNVWYEVGIYLTMFALIVGVLCK